MMITTVVAVAIDAHAAFLYETWRQGTRFPDSHPTWLNLAAEPGPDPVDGLPRDNRRYWRQEALRLSEECHRQMPELSRDKRG